MRGGRVVSCYCDYDPADIWKEVKRRARKTYTCYECREKIEPGDEYVYISTLSEGEDESRVTMAAPVSKVGALGGAWL